MRVLQLSKFYPPVMGGIESVAFELTEGLNRLGVETDVLCANLTRATCQERSAMGYRVTRAGSLAKLLSTSLSPALVLHAKRQIDRYDVVHVQMPDPMAALAIWAVRPRAKVVLHWQSDVINQRRALKLYGPLQNWLLRRADAIIATTPPYAESSPWLREFRAKIEVIPIGISESVPPDTQMKADALRERFNGKKIVFSLGRMIYYKGFDVLIDAAAALPEDCIVVVGGAGELLARYRHEVAERGLSSRICFEGRIEDADIAAYFAAADVFCLASTVRTEAFGVVLLEAMAMGKPLVTTNIAGSGVPWVNQHGLTGFTVPVNDGKALAQSLRLVLEDPALAERFGKAARARFLDVFTAAAMVDRTAALYRRLMSGSSREAGRLERAAGLE